MRDYQLVLLVVMIVGIISVLMLLFFLTIDGIVFEDVGYMKDGCTVGMYPRYDVPWKMCGGEGSFIDFIREIST